MGEYADGLKLGKWEIDIFVLSSLRMEKQYTTHFLIEDLSHENELF